ncbi:MAG: copper chaperone PCu(A)C [Pseudomonadota bacterium]
MRTRTLTAATLAVLLTSASTSYACWMHETLNEAVSTHDGHSHSGSAMDGDSIMNDDAMEETSMDHGDMTVASPHGPDMVEVGDMHLFGIFTQETPPNARAAGGYFSIHNHGTDNRLVAASSSMADRVELHTMTMEDDVMRMRELEDGIAVPAEGLIKLKPGGMHVMFMGLAEPFSVGDVIPVTLEFEGGETANLLMPVRERTIEMDHSDHSGHGSHTQ